MPFTMTHLCVADRLGTLLMKDIQSVPQFFLGNISPDAIHNRPTFNYDYKKASHLCVGDERWGMITNNDEWLENVFSFMNKHKCSEQYCFILGYCCHILTDMYNNINVWTPFRQKYQEELEKGNLGRYRQESEKMDIELALTLENRHEIWRNLEESKGVDLEDIILAKEIELQKINILRNWYAGKDRQDLSLNEIVTYSGTMDFVENAAEFIVDQLRNSKVI